MLGAGMEAAAGTRTGNHHAGIAPVMVVNEACRLLAPCEPTRWRDECRAVVFCKHVMSACTRVRVGCAYNTCSAAPVRQQGDNVLAAQNQEADLV